jgi:hypothetical protein
MRHIQKPQWDLRPYVGSFENVEHNILAVITLACEKLTVTVWGSADMPMSLIPHNLRSSLFPDDMFPIGQCFPKADTNGSAESVSSMNFTQEGGSIVGFEWSSKRGRDLVFERSKDKSLIKLAEPESPFVRLPGELRNKIYNYLYEDEEIQLVHYGDKTRFATCGDRTQGPKDEKDVRLDSIKDVCKQLYQETKGIFLPKARITTSRGVFAKFIQRKDTLLHGRLRHVNIVNGFKELLRRRNVAEVLFPIMDFCKSNPRVSVRIFLDDLIYDPHNPIAFIRKGMMIRKSFRDDRKFCFNDDKRAVRELRGGRGLEEVNVPNMKLLSARGQRFEGIARLRRRIAMLLRDRDADAKKIVDAYGGDRQWMFDEVLRMFMQGM